MISVSYTHLDVYKRQDLDSAIRSGYFLKEGLSNNEDFYYLNTLITITAESLEELEWRSNEMKKLLLSQDMEAVSCHFREEQALLSALPLVSLEKKLFERSKRNLLTTSAASCYPFTSFETAVSYTHLPFPGVDVTLCNGEIYVDTPYSAIGITGPYSCLLYTSRCV